MKVFYSLGLSYRGIGKTSKEKLIVFMHALRFAEMDDLADAAARLLLPNANES